MEWLRPKMLLAGCLAAAALALCLLPRCAAADDDVTARYFEQLRQRRLFSLAEGYCLSRLAEDDISLARRTTLTTELARTFAEHARYTSGKEQAELWQQATDVIDSLLTSHPENPRRLLLETERAFGLAAQGEYLRWQGELFPHDTTLKPRAAAAFQQALAHLKELEQTAIEAARRTVPRGSGDEGLSSYESRALSHHIRYRIGQALTELGRLEPAGSPDRVATLMEAEQWLESLANGSPEQKLTLESRLLLAESSRLRGDRKKAADVIESMQDEKPPQAVRDGMQALEARLLLDAGQPDDAAALLAKYRTERLRFPGELQFLQIEALSRLWQMAVEHDKPDLAAQFMEQIEAHADQADMEVGGFWAYRCRLLVSSARETRRYGAELAAVVREARAAYAAGQIETAVAAYDRAVTSAQQAGQAEIAMDLGYTQASVQLESGKYQSAADSFQRLAEAFPENSRAPTAHLLAAYSLGRAYEQQRTKARRERYTEALVRHRKRYAGDETAQEATWMLARLEERRLQVTRALKLYREISIEHSRGPLAQVAVARCYEKILDRVRELDRPTAAWENDAIARLEQMVAAFPAGEQPLSLQQTEVCLRLARICLNRQQPDYAAAGKLFDRLAASQRRRRQEQQATPDEKAADMANRWNLLHQAATQLRIVTLAGRGQLPEARRLVQTLSQAEPRDALGILDGLNDLTAAAGERTRHQLGELQLSTARDLDARRDELNTEDQRRLDHCLAQAYVATGRSPQAIAIYEALLAGSPRNPRLLRTVAELLTRCGTRDCLTKAKSYWRKLESQRQAGDAQWMNARYHTALCCFELKQYDECRKLLAVTRVVYPELGGDELRMRFMELEMKLPVDN